MNQRKAWATKIVAPKQVGSTTTKVKMKPSKDEAHCFFAMVSSRLERGPEPRVLSPKIANWLLNPTARFETTFSTPDTFQEQILTEIDDKTRVYWRTMA